MPRGRSPRRVGKAASAAGGQQSAEMCRAPGRVKTVQAAPSRAGGGNAARFLIPPTEAIPVPGPERFPRRRAAGLLFQHPAKGRWRICPTGQRPPLRKEHRPRQEAARCPPWAGWSLARGFCHRHAVQHAHHSVGAQTPARRRAARMEDFPVFGQGPVPSAGFQRAVRRQAADLAPVHRYQGRRWPALAT